MFGLVFTVFVVAGLGALILRAWRRESQLRRRALAPRERGLIWNGPVDVRLTWSTISLTKQKWYFPHLDGFIPLRSRGAEAWVHPAAIEIGTRLPAPNAYWLFELEDTVATAATSELPGAGWLILESSAQCIALRSKDGRGLFDALSAAGFKVFTADWSGCRAACRASSRDDDVAVPLALDEFLTIQVRIVAPPSGN